LIDALVDESFVGVDAALLQFDRIAVGRTKYCGIVTEHASDDYLWEAGAVVCVEDGQVVWSWGGKYVDISLNDDFSGWDVVCAAQSGGELRCTGFDLEDPLVDAQYVGVSFFNICAANEDTARCYVSENVGGAPPPSALAPYSGIAVGAAQICTTDGATLHTVCEGNTATSGQVRQGHYLPLAIGGSAACGVDVAEAKVHCWDNNTPEIDEPTVLEGNFRPFEPQTLAINLNNDGCAIDAEGAVHCFGDADFSAVEAANGRFQRVALSVQQVCVLNEDGYAECYPLGLPGN
jgi:hypothetical protein